MFISFSAILVRLASVSPSSAALFRCVYALPFLALLAWREDRKFGTRPQSQRWIARSAGVFFALDLVFWHISIDAIGAGLATVLGNMQVIFVPALAWAIYKERPGGRTAIALPVVVAGLILISGVIGENNFGKDPLKGAAYGALTALAYTGFMLRLRSGNRDLRRPAGPLFDATLSTAIVVLIIGLAGSSIDLTPSWPAHGWLALLAVESQVIGWLLISIALPRLKAVSLSLLILLQPVLSMIFSAVLIGERPSLVQLCGVGLVLVAIVAGTTRTSDAAPTQ